MTDSRLIQFMNSIDKWNRIEELAWADDNSIKAQGAIHMKVAFTEAFGVTLIFHNDAIIIAVPRHNDYDVTHTREIVSQAGTKFYVAVRA